VSDPELLDVPRKMSVLRDHQPARDNAFSREPAGKLFSVRLLDRGDRHADG
jgi:hypothetical protein